MARSFVRASSQRLTYPSPIVTAVPFSVAAWVNPTTGVSNYIFSVSDAGPNNFFDLLLHAGSPNQRVLAQCYDGVAGGTAATTVAATLGAWNHAAGVFTNNSSRSAFLNGANKVTETTTVTPNVAGLTTYIGHNAYDANYLNGLLAEVGVWDVALSDDEVAALAKGFCPLLIRPQSLIAYWPLFGNQSPEPDRWKNRYDLTLTGSPAKADHPRIYYPE